MEVEASESEVVSLSLDAVDVGVVVLGIDGEETESLLVGVAADMPAVENDDVDSARVDDVSPVDVIGAVVLAEFELDGCWVDAVAVLVISITVVCKTLVD